MWDAHSFQQVKFTKKRTSLLRAKALEREGKIMSGGVDYFTTTFLPLIM